MQYKELELSRYREHVERYIEKRPNGKIFAIKSTVQEQNAFNTVLMSYQGLVLKDLKVEVVSGRV